MSQFLTVPYKDAPVAVDTNLGDAAARPRILLTPEVMAQYPEFTVPEGTRTRLVMGATIFQILE